MKKVILVTNPFGIYAEGESVEGDNCVTEHDVEILYDFLVSKFAKFPDNARIYHGGVSKSCDVTPTDEAEIDHLETLPGPFYVVCYPGGYLEVIELIVIVISLALAAYTLLTIPNVAGKNQQTPAPSNTLSDRTNEARIKARIPDIVGTVRSTPDLLQVPYRLFDTNSQEFELSYMCASRGYLDVDAENVFDGDTQISQIKGEAIEIYAPFTSPNSGDAPQLRIGEAIGMGIISVQKSNSVNGQTLLAPNYKYIGLDCSDIFFAHVPGSIDGLVLLEDGSNFNFTKYFELGDLIAITSPTYTVSGHTINVTGVYTVGGTQVKGKELTLTNAVAVTTDWNNIDFYPLDVLVPYRRTPSMNGPILDAYLVDGVTGLSSSKWIGPFILDDPDITGLINNFVMLNGAYKTNGDDIEPFPVTIEIGTMPVDQFGISTGGETLTSYTLPSSAVDLTQKALSAVLTVSGRTSVRAHRLTLNDYTYKGTVSDTVQWRDLYGTSPVTQTDFGNVTTIQTLTTVTPASLGIKERKINLICTRMIPARIGTTSTFGALAASNSAADILCFVALDPYIGNRTIGEIDVENIYDTLAEVVSYFDISEAGEFCYTLDNADFSYEETAIAIATAVFCTAYRQGPILSLTFEKQTDDSTLLFNHRNIEPDSEQRNVRFGTLDDADGIEYSYVDPTDETTETFYVPEDQSAIKPQTIQSIGVRNNKQARLAAYRAYNKLLFQNVNTSFNATREADLVVRTNRILVADTTRPNAQTGEILDQTILTLELSQPFTYTALDHAIFLQLYDGTIQSIDIVASDASPSYSVTIAYAPSLPLVFDDDARAKTTYQIAGNTGAQSSAFLVDTKDNQDRSLTQVSAINYDARYYANDLDFKNPLIDTSGNAILDSSGGTILTG